MRGVTTLLRPFDAQKIDFGLGSESATATPGKIKITAGGEVGIAAQKNGRSWK
jgi:hypothetical protein|tara:strand:+ start:957 stop:1115 length:159 start_codon:yes stop_codon:yes gene_type:complete